MDYHIDRFLDRSIVVMSSGKCLAVFPCNQIENSIVSHGGLTYGGLLFENHLHASDVLEIFTRIGRYFQSADCERLVYKCIPYVFQRYPADEDLYALYRVGAKLIRRDISSVIETAGRPKFSDSRKNTIKKAEKAGVVFVELSDFVEFHNLLSQVLIKFDKKPTHSVDELRLLKSRFPTGIRLFGATLGGRLVAAVLIYDFGHIAHSQYMASSSEGRSLGALDYLLAELIQRIFAQRKYFSFGISTENGGQYLNEGLIRQKEGFGGRGIVHDSYEWVF